MRPATTGARCIRCSCKGGVCSTCRCKLVERKVEMEVKHALEGCGIVRDFGLSFQAFPVADCLALDVDQGS